MPSSSLIGAAALAVAVWSAGAGPPGPEPPAPQTGTGIPAPGTYAWPVEGPVIRTFDPPGTPFGSGHRGIDIEAPSGSVVRAAERGVVAFAGAVAGSLYVSIDHPDGVRTTCSWLSSLAVERGDRIDRGEVLGASGPGHPGQDPAHLHFGARFEGRYIDPLLLLERGDMAGLVHLAPLSGRSTGGGAPGL